MNIAMKRSGLLSAFLAISFGLYMLGVSFYLTDWDKMNAALPSWAAFVLTTVAFLRPVSLLGIWLWSRSGIVANVIFTIADIFVRLALGSKMSFANIGITVILVALVWPKWRFMFWKLSAQPKAQEDDAHAA